MQPMRIPIPDVGRSLVVEFIGAFALIFAAVAAIALTGGGNLVTIGLAHGLAIGLMFAAMGHISGGHFNPAVTVAMFLAGKIDAVKGVFYIAAQLAGATAAAAVLRYVLDAVPAPEGYSNMIQFGTPALAEPVINEARGLVLEGLATFLLVLVIFGTAVDTRSGHRGIAGLAIGLTITLAWYAEGGLTGAALNPARSFGPALIGNEWTNWWIYWVGPIVGAAVAGLLYTSVIMGDDE